MRNKGFFLLELLITLFLASLLIQSVMSLFLNCQKHIVSILEKHIHIQEIIFLDSFLHYDLLSFSNLQIGENSFNTTNVEDNDIFYSLVSGNIRRRYNYRSYFYLSKVINFHSLESINAETIHYQLSIKKPKTNINEISITNVHY